MARQDLDGVWTVLSTRVPATGLAVAPIGYTVAAGELLAGIDSESRRHLLIPLGPGEPGRTDMKGRAVHLGRLAHDGATYLTVFCLLPELHRVFTQFSRELSETVEDAVSPAKEASESFDRWRALFSDAAGFGLIGDDKLVGLIGELLTLEELLAHGAPSDLAFWRGPLNEVHDFRTVHHAVEVKATLARDGRIVSISSVDQLQPPAGCDLHLRHLQLERDPGGFNLREVLDQVRAAGAQDKELASLLNEEGVDLRDSSPYDGRRFRLVASRTYDTEAIHFPRVVRGSFAEGDLPVGTMRLSYSIDLTNEPPVPLDAAGAASVLAALAKDVSGGLDP